MLASICSALSTTRICLAYQLFMRGPFFLNGSIASVTFREWSGTTSASSNSLTVPRPAQLGHAPCGELNEKSRGASSSSAHSGCSAHANFSLNLCSTHFSLAFASFIAFCRALILRESRRNKSSDDCLTTGLLATVIGLYDLGAEVGVLLTTPPIIFMKFVFAIFVLV